MREFWKGFEKKAVSKNTGLGIYFGSLAGVGLATAYIQHDVNKTLKGFKEHDGNVDARKSFAKIKHLSPDTELVTESELRKKIKGEGGFLRKRQLESFADALSKGNAFAYHPEIGGLHIMVPDFMRNKKIIMSADKVHPSVLAHEMGHVIDYDEIGKKPAFKKFVSKYLRGTVGRETAAWDKAPGNGHEELKVPALRSYKNVAYGLPIAAGVGGILGGLIGRKL